MDWDSLYGGGVEPGDAEISEFIGSGLWPMLNEYLREAYGVQPKKSYSNCSAQRGWNVKYQKGGKSLCTLYPMPGHFIALVVIGAKEAPEAGLLAPALSGYTRKLYEDTPFSCGGKWLMISVRDEDALNDVKRLVSLRVKPKKK